MSSQVTALAGLALLAIGVGQWTGRIRPTSQDPDAFGDRLYLFAPLAVALLLIAGGGVVSDVLDRPEPGGVALAVATPFALAAAVLLVWRPHRVRPHWDDRPRRARRR